MPLLLSSYSLLQLLQRQRMNIVYTRLARNPPELQLSMDVTVLSIDLTHSQATWDWPIQSVSGLIIEVPSVGPTILEQGVSILTRSGDLIVPDPIKNPSIPLPQSQKPKIHK